MAGNFKSSILLVMSVKVKTKKDTVVVTVKRNLKNIKDYLKFRDTIKSEIENCLNNSFHKLNFIFVFEKNVTFVNASSLGFMIWLTKEYANRVCVEVLNRELFRVLNTVGLNSVWSISFKN